MKKVAKKTLSKLKKAAREGRIVMADASRVKELRPYVDRVCDAICDAVGIERGVLVTDESYVSDFLSWPTRDHLAENKIVLRKVSKALGIIVKDEHIVDVAERLRKSELT